MKDIKKTILGIIYCLFVSFLAKEVASFIPAVGWVMIALILGVLGGNLLKINHHLEKGFKFCSKQVLSLAIVFMAFQLRTDHLEQVTGEHLVVILLMIFCIFLIVRFSQRRFKMDPEVSSLVGIGSAICGSAAIAACSPYITNHKNKIGISLAAINLVGLLAMFSLPFLISFLHLAVTPGSFLVGTTLQSIGHVVATSSMYSMEFANLALSAKMIRVLLLIPLVLFFALRKSGKASQALWQVPAYIWAFILVVITVNTVDVSEKILSDLHFYAKLFMAVAMVAIGQQIQIVELMKQSTKILGIAFIITLFQLIYLILYVTCFAS